MRGLPCVHQTKVSPRSPSTGRARIGGREDGHRADGLQLHPLERCLEDFAKALLGVAEVVEGAAPVVDLENVPR